MTAKKPKLWRPSAIVVHCSGTSVGDAESFRRYHTQTLGWSDIGYHAVILNGHRDSHSGYQEVLDGKIEPGRPETVMGSHCKADCMNGIALGVCLVGDPGANRDYVTDKQMASLIYWLNINCRQYGIPLGNITQHSDHERAKPHCASLDMRKLQKDIRAYLLKWAR